MRTRYDQFAKQMTRAALGPGGTVHTDEEVSPDVGRIDVWFTPHDREATRALATLGMLGRIGRAACTLEAFHQTPDPLEVMDCISKHHSFRRLLARRDPHLPLPLQWIVSAGCPVGALAGLACAPCSAWGPGVHDAPPLLHTRVVVVSELPRTRDTLMLRLMGAGRVLADAVADLRDLGEDALESALALPILLRLNIDAEVRAMEVSPEDKEFLMITQDIVDEYIQKQRTEGRTEGREEGFASAVIRVYTRRFGAPPADVAARITECHDTAKLEGWLDLAATGSVEDLPSAVRSVVAS